MSRIVILIAVLLASGRWLGADTLHVTADASAGPAAPDSPFGRQQWLTVAGGADQPHLLAYVAFDLGALPDEADVQKATLRVWVNAVAAAGTVEVLPILEPWDEERLTGRSAPGLGRPVAEVEIGPDAMRYVQADVTSLVRAWSRGELENHGLVLRSAGSVSVRSFPRRRSATARTTIARGPRISARTCPDAAAVFPTRTATVTGAARRARAASSPAPAHQPEQPGL